MCRDWNWIGHALLGTRISDTPVVVGTIDPSLEIAGIIFTRQNEKLSEECLPRSSDSRQTGNGDRRTSR